MTEKRFELNNIVKVGTVSFWDNENQKIVNATDTLNLLNVLNDEVIAQRIVIEGYQNRNQQLFDENEQLKLDLKHIQDSLWTTELINNFKEKIEQLQARNDRQAKQLGNLYNLIEKEDWKTLKGIIEEFKESDKRLQKEYNYEVDMND